jgi:hypothetical protein
MSSLFDHLPTADPVAIASAPGPRTHARTDGARPHAPIAHVLPRQRVIEHIVRINPGASASFLERFNDPALRTYLEHLEHAEAPRGAHSRWVRRNETSAFNTCVLDD